MKNNFTVKLALAMAVTIAMIGCSEPTRRQSSGLNARFVYGNDVPFDEYVTKTREMIAKARVDLNDANRDSVIDANSPFELIPPAHCETGKDGKYEKGILLIHGLWDSPYMVRSIGEHLNENCFLVLAILLPGHGTVPGDMLFTQYRDWIKATGYGIGRLMERVDKIFLGGYSTGGALAINQALKRPENFEAIILFSPALRISSNLAPFAGIAKHFKRWMLRQDDKDYAKYESLATNSVSQVYKLLKENGQLFTKGRTITMPLFAALSADDSSVISNETIRFFRGAVKSDKSVMYLYDRKTSNGSREDTRIKVLKGSLPDKNILEFSHVSIPIRPDDSHYGKEGDYKYCLQYSGDEDKRQVCLNGGDNLREGEIQVEHEEGIILRRLTYNPSYNGMVDSLDNFLAGIM